MLKTPYARGFTVLRCVGQVLYVQQIYEIRRCWAEGCDGRATCTQAQQYSFPHVSLLTYSVDNSSIPASSGDAKSNNAVALS